MIKHKKQRVHTTKNTSTHIHHTNLLLSPAPLQMYGPRHSTLSCSLPTFLPCTSLFQDSTLFPPLFIDCPHSFLISLRSNHSILNQLPRLQHLPHPPYPPPGSIFFGTAFSEGHGFGMMFVQKPRGAGLEANDTSSLALTFGFLHPRPSAKLLHMSSAQSSSERG